jgi:nucleotide-binding universal stress UspA family protein
MTERVLVPMDGSEMAERALEYALNNHEGATITVLHVVGVPSPMMGGRTGLALESDPEAAAEEAAAELFERVRELAEGYDVGIETDVAWGNPAKLIVDRAEGFDTVVVGSHSGSIADRLFVGNVAQKVVRHSPVPVTVVR